MIKVQRGKDPPEIGEAKRGEEGYLGYLLQTLVMPRSDPKLIGRECYVI